MDLMPNPQPQTPFFLRKSIFISFIVLITLFIAIILLNYFRIIPLSAKVPLLSFLPTRPLLIAEVNGEKIYDKELEITKGLFSTLRGKSRSDAQIKEESLNFIIERRLLEEEAQKRGIDVSGVVNKRFNATISQYGNQKNLEQNLHTDSNTYRTYLINQAIKETLVSLALTWKEVDYLSIRYLWNENPDEEEKAFKDLAAKKIQEYESKIKSGLSIREAIKQRCQDPKIDYFAFGIHRKIYSETFDGNSCWEQRLGIKVSKDTNPEWGDSWLKEIFKLKKGEISQIINIESPSVGLYFIVSVLNEGGDSIFSLEELIDDLKNNSTINTYI